MVDEIISLEPYKEGAVQSVAAEEDWEKFDSFFSSKESTSDPQNPQDPFSTSSFGVLDGVFQSLPALDNVLTETSDLKPRNIPTSLSSLYLLQAYKGCGYNKMKGRILNQPKLVAAVNDHQRLSTEEVMRVAGAQYINFSIPGNSYNLSILSSPSNFSVSGLTDEETKDVRLAHLLLATAEKIGNRQFNRGSNLLAQCVNLSSATGSPVQRIVYYFSQALQEKINRESGRPRHAINIASVVKEALLIPPNATILDCHKVLPFGQITIFTSVQAIVESVGLAKKVHLIDFGVRTGILWPVLMQDLASRNESPIEALKITAVCTNNEQEIQNEGRMLASLAESMGGFRFSFNVIRVSNMEDIEEGQFELEEDESIVVYTGFVLRTMLTSCDRLDSLMRVIRNLDPCIMIVAEAEANHNSPLFFSRFIECLFYFSAFFDCLETCMERNSQNRIKTEALYFGEAIVNIVATEGEERIFRNVGVDVWRSFFARFKMFETDFSSSSIYQAKLVKEQFAHWSSCTLDMNGKCIIVNWKGTPLFSISAWKFL